MPSQTSKIAAVAIGAATTFSSPTAYNVSYSTGEWPVPRVETVKAIASAGVPVMISEQLLEAKLEAVEARVELRLVDRLKGIADPIGDLATRLTRIEGSVGALDSKIDSKPGTWKLAIAIGASVLTGFGAVLAALAFAGDRFDGGMSVSGVLVEKQYDADQREKALNAKVDCLILKTENPRSSCK